MHVTHAQHVRRCIPELPASEAGFSRMRFDILDEVLGTQKTVRDSENGSVQENSLLCEKDEEVQTIIRVSKLCFVGAKALPFASRE